MANYLRIILSLAALFVLSSCSDKDGGDDIAYLAIDEKFSDVWFDSTSASQSMTITGECNSDWSVDYIQTVVDWLDISPRNGSGNISFTISTNEKYLEANETRSTAIVVTSEGMKSLIVVNQEGIVGSATVNPTQYSNVAKEGGELTLRVTTNTTCTVKCPDGVQILNGSDYYSDFTLSASDSAQSLTLVVAKNENSDGSSKVHTVSVVSDYFETKSVTITQNAYVASELALSASTATVFKDCTNLSLDTVYVTTDEDSTWSVAGDGSNWYSVSRNEEDDFFTIEVTGKNETGDSRDGIITITATNGIYATPTTKTFTLTQTTEEIYVTLSSEDKVEFTAVTDILNELITVTSNVECEIDITYTDDSGWLDVEFMSDFVKDTARNISVEATQNTLTTERSATVTIKASENVYKTFTVTQSARTNDLDDAISDGGFTSN